jgi:1-acyl-sn-glycerol-3-phosphate acyltransferase
MSAIAGQPATSSAVDSPVRASTAAGRVLAAACRTWRSAAQVALFGVFGAGGALMTGIVAPALSLTVADPERRAHLARRYVRGFLAAYTGAMQVLRLIRLEVTGAEHLAHGGALVVANHPTLIDAFFLLGRVPGLVPIAKRALAVNPFTRGAIAAANYLVNDDGPALLETCRERLAAGETLLLFPEGTRTAADGAVRLRRGAAQVAVRCGCPIVPVRIDVDERFLVRETPWWLAARSVPRIRITAHAPIDPAPFVAASANPALAARRLTERLQTIYL